MQIGCLNNRMPPKAIDQNYLMTKIFNKNFVETSKYLIVFCVSIKDILNARLCLKSFKLTGLIGHKKHLTYYEPARLREFAAALKEEERMLKFGVVMPQLNPSPEIYYQLKVPGSEEQSRVILAMSDR
jgi:hypothetical protein